MRAKSVLVDILIVITVVFFLPFSSSAVPQTMNYQGFLTDSSGAPVDGSVTLSFRIYDAASAGSQLWAASPPAVMVTKGVYNVELGGLTQAVFSADNRYLEISANGTAMTPRQKLSSVAFAIKAGDSDTVDSKHATDFAASGANTDITSLTGIGGSDPQGLVRAANSIGTSGYLGGTYGVYGQSSGSYNSAIYAIASGFYSAGVTGLNTNSEGTAVPGYGVMGQSGTSFGALGMNGATWPYECNCYDDGTDVYCDTCYESQTGAAVYGQAAAPGYAGLFHGNVMATGQVIAGSATVTGQVSAGSATVNGLVNAGSATVTGQISAGSYIGNGAGLANTHMKWQTVTGASRQAVSNTGYMVNNTASQVVITLPASPGVGDIVRVSGIGAGGWKLSQNAGQLVITRNVPKIGITWNSQDSDRIWQSVASSADGTKLVAAESSGHIYTSTDSGATWTPRESINNWLSVASSSDGTHLVAVVNGGGIDTSPDSGATWSPRMIYLPNKFWSSVASSADGSKLVAAATGDRVYTSTDWGSSWHPQEMVRDWRSVASSSDGTRLLAAARSGQLYTSTDSGANWTTRMADANRNWQSVATSSDGTKLLAAVRGGQLYTSTDSGANWTARMTDANRNWQSVASSSDGTKLIAGVNGGQLYTSADSGINWTPQMTEATKNWQSVASSSGGSKLVAVDMGGKIYTSTPSELGVQTTTVGTGGNLSGCQFDAAELQYIGNSQFMLLSHEGYLNIQ